MTIRQDHQPKKKTRSAETKRAARLMTMEAYSDAWREVIERFSIRIVICTSAFLSVCADYTMSGADVNRNAAKKQFKAIKQRDRYNHLKNKDMRHPKKWLAISVHL